VNRELGLRVLSQIMSWNDEEARKEFRWLSFISKYKYDGYRDYLAGARFIESLSTWLQQFKPDDRRTAYEYIKKNLIYIGPAEMKKLIERFYPEIVQRHLVEITSKSLGMRKHKIWATDTGIKEYDRQVRKILFMGLSDGAMIDVFRRVNAGIIANDQIVTTTQIDITKWEGVIKDLREDLKKKKLGNGKDEKFSHIYLIDDFTASGTSLIRCDTYQGKIDRFYISLLKAIDALKSSHGDILDQNWQLVIHHYIGTDKVKQAIRERYSHAIQSGKSWNTNVNFTFSMLLPTGSILSETSQEPFAKLCKNYYDPALEGDGKHGKESGNPDKKFGFGQCGLTVVLEHNTPNNSVPLLWAETSGKGGHHPMRPLFRRRERFSDLTE